VTVNGGGLVNGASSPIPLVEGGTTDITLVVTAQDQTAPKTTYVVTVTRAPNTIADLTSIKVGIGSLAPAFQPNITNYEVIVGNMYSSFGITPVRTIAYESIKINNVSATSGQQTVVNLLPAYTTAGSNTTQKIGVTAQDKTVKKTYLIKVHRMATPVPTPAPTYVPANGTTTNLVAAVTLEGISPEQFSQPPLLKDTPIVNQTSRWVMVFKEVLIQGALAIHSHKVCGESGVYPNGQKRNRLCTPSDIDLDIIGYTREGSNVMLQMPGSRRAMPLPPTANSSGMGFDDTTMMNTTTVRYVVKIAQAVKETAIKDAKAFTQTTLSDLLIERGMPIVRASFLAFGTDSAAHTQSDEQVKAPKARSISQKIAFKMAPKDYTGKIKAAIEMGYGIALGIVPVWKLPHKYHPGCSVSSSAKAARRAAATASATATETEVSFDATIAAGQVTKQVDQKGMEKGLTAAFSQDNTIFPPTVDAVQTASTSYPQPEDESFMRKNLVFIIGFGVGGCVLLCLAIYCCSKLCSSESSGPDTSTTSSKFSSHGGNAPPSYAPTMGIQTNASAMDIDIEKEGSAGAVVNRL
jgi:hypothetical protein